MSFSYDPTLPNPPNDPADDVDQMQINSQSISDLISVDHVGFNDPSGGTHDQVTFSSNNTPATPTNPPVLFTKLDGASLAQLFFYTGDAAHSSTQYSPTNNNGSTMALGGIIIKWGSGSMTSGASGTDVNFISPFPNNLFAILAWSNDGGTQSTANTAVYGRKQGAALDRFNLLTTLRTSTGSASASYTYIAIGN